METKKNTSPLSGVALGKWMTEQKKAEQKRMREEWKTDPLLQAAVSELDKYKAKHGTYKIAL